MYILQNERIFNHSSGTNSMKLSCQSMSMFSFFIHIPLHIGLYFDIS